MLPAKIPFWGFFKEKLSCACAGFNCLTCEISGFRIFVYKYWLCVFGLGKTYLGGISVSRLQRQRKHSTFYILDLQVCVWGRVGVGGKFTLLLAFSEV